MNFQNKAARAAVGPVCGVRTQLTSSLPHNGLPLFSFPEQFEQRAAITVPVTRPNDGGSSFAPGRRSGQRSGQRSGHLCLSVDTFLVRQVFGPDPPLPRSSVQGALRCCVQPIAFFRSRRFWWSRGESFTPIFWLRPCKLTHLIQRSAPRLIHLPEDDPVVLHSFLEFLYTGAYKGGVAFAGGRPEPIVAFSKQAVEDALQDPAGGSIPPVTEEDDDVDMESDDTAMDDEEKDDKAEEDGEEDEDEHEENHDDEMEEDEDDDVDTKTSKFSDASTEPEEEYKEFDDEKEVKNLLVDGKIVIKDVDVPADNSGRQELLELHLHLYLMADKYDVPALRLMAREGFYRELEMLSDNPADFSDMVDGLYDLTTEGDFAIREMACRLAAACLWQEEYRKLLYPIMRKHGDFAVGVMEYANVFDRGIME